MNLILRIFRLLSNFSRRWMIKQRKTGAGLLRIAFGSLTAILYALHLNQRALLWGPDGVISWGDQAMMQGPEPGLDTLSVFSIGRRRRVSLLGRVDCITHVYARLV
jgi:hypothetical protein